MAIYAECSSPGGEHSLCSLEELQKEQKRLEDLMSKNKLLDKHNADEDLHVQKIDEKKIEHTPKHQGQLDSHKKLNSNFSKLND